MAYGDANTTPDETRQLVDRLHLSVSPIVHPQRILQAVDRERPAFGRANEWLADHVVAIAGTMAFFHALWIIIAGWAAWQSAIEHNDGFDPFPYAFLFFVLGGIMQSLFVPTMLVTSNRAAARDRVKDEADHRAWSHLYEVNEEQLRLLRQLAAA
ncbi:MAG: DUF1003 domain-containing protein, partial [Hyphomicrobiales bacterium]